jgi:hypothetical protein
MRSEQTIERYQQRAAELRTMAAQTNDQLRRDWLIAAAESYEKLASWNAPELINRDELLLD